MPHLSFTPLSSREYFWIIQCTRLERGYRDEVNTDNQVQTELPGKIIDRPVKMGIR